MDAAGSASSILTLNAGSSSLKFALFPWSDGPATLRGEASGLNDPAGARLVFGGRDQPLRLAGGSPHAGALLAVLDALKQHAASQVAAIGHRIVHGGTAFADSVVIDEAALHRLEALTPLAPLHQPANLAGVRAVSSVLPDVPQVACFDTAFHRTQAEAAQWFALPRAYAAQGVRRYGFHGLSYEHVAHVLPTLAGDRAGGRVIVAHLGAGASLCALHGLRSVATSMGFSALDGLMMGTRCGAIDPGVLIYLQRAHGMDADALEDLLYRRSGLLGVSGISADMRELLASRQPQAAEAVELFCYRAVREICALAGVLGGFDALVFTGGIGTYAAAIRQRIAGALEWLGLRLDRDANDTPIAANTAGKSIAAADSKVACWVIRADEESVIARHVRRTIGASR